MEPAVTPTPNAAVDARRSSYVTVPEIVGFSFSGLGVLWSAIAAIVLQPAFSRMFVDFGSADAIPPFTHLCLRPWFPLSLAVLPMLPVGVGVLSRATRPIRVALMSLAILLTLALPAVFLVGMYLPIFRITALIK
jgi:hypothetical protein